MGYSKAELLQLSYQAVTHPDDLAHQTELLRQLFSRQTDTATIEKRYLTRDGRSIWVRVTLSVVLDHNNRVVSDLALVEDISDRKRTELALEESRARFEGIFNQAAVGISLASMTGHVISVNQWFCDFLGYGEAELRQLTFADYSHPEDQAQDDALMQRLIAGEIPNFTLEKRYFRKSGELRWASLTVSLVRDPEGNPLYDIAIIQDIDERKQTDLALKTSLSHLQRAETQVRQSQEQLKLTLDFSGIGAWIWNPVTGAYSWGGLTESLLDLPSGLDNMFQIWRDRIHPEDVERVEASIQTALTTRSAFSEEYRYTLSDGRPVWRWMKGQGVYTETGKLERVLGVVQDVDELKSLEQTLQDSKNQLTDILSNTNACIIRFRLFADYTWAYDYYSPGSERIYGYPPEALQGDINLWASRVFPEDLEQVIRPALAAIAAGQTVGDIEYRFRHSDGTMCWIQENCTARWSPTPKLLACD
ncbi:MAG: PAS domain-containing protein [Leptolyngbyaceae cyanobacterium SM2_3_12]|nr:PAS domain-containing protein [Leptolyngbyaceae cyanobacterium SM2_3_12]